MSEIDRAVFGRITIKEIIGAQPPAVPDTRDMLGAELGVMLSALEGKSRTALLLLLEAQRDAASRINSRPGAMALAHDKIRIFNEYNDAYMRSISAKCAGSD